MNQTIEILEYDKLIKSIISKYTYYFDKDDLYQVAVIGLLNAKKNYNENSNTKFTTYAYFYIKGEVTKYLRESNSFKVSKDLVKINQKVEHARNCLTQKIGKIPSDLEISQYLEIDINIIESARSANSLVESLDKEQEDLNLYSTIAFNDPNMDEQIIELKDAINSLKEWEQRLIYSRYECGCTQSETSRILGMSQVQVSRKEKEILTRLRTRLR